MATTVDDPSLSDRFPGTWEYLLAGRPLLPLVVVWLITAGHAMNFREMGIAQGWVFAELYCLNTALAVSIALTLLACPALGRRASCRSLARLGLLLLAGACFLNGLYVHAPFSVFLAGRALAGVGVGLVIVFTPRLLDNRWENPTSWASILLPVAGPGAIAAASMIHGWSDWEWAFLIEGIAALLSLLVLLSMRHVPDVPPTAPRGSLAFLPSLVLGSAALFFCLHWGQLYGWLESGAIVVAAATGILSLAITLLRVAPWIDLLALKEGWIRLLLFFFGGACQWFHGASMNIYGGLLLNFSTWQRSLLIWSLPLGVATSLVIARVALRRWRISLDLPGAIAGLLILAAGMFHSYERTLDWPYWQIQNVADLNWFPAPQYWELAPGRFLMGVGIGLFLIAMDTMASPDPNREERIQPFLLVMQFYGGGMGIAVLVNFFLIGHPIHYSYVADRDFIQAGEFAERRAVLREALSQAGEPEPDRQAEVLLYRTVNYEADNLVFAEIYASFMLAALGLAVLCSGMMAGKWLRPPPRAEAP